MSHHQRQSSPPRLLPPVQATYRRVSPERQKISSPIGPMALLPTPVPLGYEGLMSSLISPSSSTPTQNGFRPPWHSTPNHQYSHNQHHQHQHQHQWQPNGQINSESHLRSTSHSGPLPSSSQAESKNQSTPANKATDDEAQRQALSASTEAAHSLASLFQAGAPQPTPTKTPEEPDAVEAGENAQKLNDLRARLLAKKSRKATIDAASVARPRGRPRKDKSAGSDSNKSAAAQTPKAPKHAPEASISTDSCEAGVSPKTEPKREFVKTQMHHDDRSIDTRNQNWSGQPRAKSSVSSGGDASSQPLPKEYLREIATSPNSPGSGLKAINGSLNVPETEARASLQQRTKSSTQLSDDRRTSVSAARKDSLTNEEKVRRANEVEAVYQPAPSTKRNSEEKLRRQSQVDLVYSPLTRQDSSAFRAQVPSGETGPRRKASLFNEPGRSAPCDPGHPVGHTRTARKLSILDKNGRRISDEEYRRRMIDSNARAAAAYKRSLESRAQHSANVPPPHPYPPSQSHPHPNHHQHPASTSHGHRVLSSTKTTYLGRSTDDSSPVDRSAAPSNVYLAAPGSETLPPRTSLTTDPDLLEWLELTEYHDLEYRQGRLSRFRKRKELEKLQLEIDQEEQAAQQQRALARVSVSNSHHSGPRSAVTATAHSTLATPVEPPVIISSSTLKRHHDVLEPSAHGIEPNPHLHLVPQAATSGKRPRLELQVQQALKGEDPFPGNLKFLPASGTHSAVLAESKSPMFRREMREIHAISPCAKAEAPVLNHTRSGSSAEERKNEIIKTDRAEDDKTEDNAAQGLKPSENIVVDDDAAKAAEKVNDGEMRTASDRDVRHAAQDSRHDGSGSDQASARDNHDGNHKDIPSTKVQDKSFTNRKSDASDVDRADVPNTNHKKQSLTNDGDGHEQSDKKDE